MKEIYTSPELVVILCDEEDIVKTSPSVGEDTETGYGPVRPIG